MSSANQGFFWWEIDVSYYVILILEKLGLVWDVRKPPPHVLTKDLVRDVGERADLLVARPSAAAAPEPTSIPAPIDAT
jgi:stearoyl-CoA desaturase (delta-9 desaturase)